MLPPLLPTPFEQPLRNGNVKKVSPAKMQMHRVKGLSYFCDVKFSFYLNYNNDPSPDFDQFVHNYGSVLDDHHWLVNDLN